MSGEKMNIGFVKEQYSQYCHMLRMHVALSWQIPSLAIVALLFLLGLESKNIQVWRSHPIWPAVGFLTIGLFLVVMFVHHRRNLFYADHYSRVLADMEKKWGVALKVHHFQVEPGRAWWQRISSSLCLSIFLFLMIVGSLAISIYYFKLIICL